MLGYHESANPRRGPTHLMSATMTHPDYKLSQLDRLQGESIHMVRNNAAEFTICRARHEVLRRQAPDHRVTPGGEGTLPRDDAVLAAAGRNGLRPTRSAGVPQPLDGTAGQW